MKRRWQFLFAAGAGLACSCSREVAPPRASEAPKERSSAPKTQLAQPQPKVPAVPLLDGDRICTGDAVSCVIADDRRVHCWGPGQSSDATLVEGVADAQKVACGYTDACAVSSDGTARCWTYDRFVAGTSTASDVVSMALGERLLCVADRAGEVACTLGSLSHLKPEEGLSDVVKVVAGYYHACALNKEGLVSCWGRDTDFQLGVSNGVSFEHGEVMGEQWLALLVGASSETADFSDVAAKTPLLRRKALECLAGARSVDAVSDRLTIPVTVRKNGSVMGVEPLEKSPEGLDPGALHGCFAPVLRREFSLPHKEPGPLAVTVVLDAMTLEEADQVVYPVITPVMDLDAQGYLTCAITDDGATWCWGSGEPFSSEKPDAIRAQHGPQRIPGLDDAVSVEVSWRNVCVLRKDRSVRCFGANPKEIFEVEPDVEHGTASDIPGFTGYRALDLGAGFGCGIDPDGIVTCFGSNRGHLGGSSPSRDRLPPTPVPNVPKLE